MNETCPCCGAPMLGSDHCPYCGCEEYESYCDMRWPGDCPILCWQFRHFDYCRHTDGPDEIDRTADDERRYDR